MNKLKIKLLLSGLIGFSVCCLLGYAIFQSYENSKNIQAQISQAERVRYKILAAANSPFYKSRLDDLIEEQGKLKPKYRDESFSKIIKAHKSKNRSQLNKDITFFRKQEDRYSNYLDSNLAAYESRIFSLVVGFLVCFFITLGLILHTAIISTLRPIKRLSSRMIDFLNNRYSYQFRVPSSSEVGELELNFHSLAQRVINNIEELKALDSAKSDFLNIASHELRTPLTSIKGSLNLLKSSFQSLDPEKTKQLMTIAESETDRLIRLINDLLDLAKIESGRMTLEKDWASIDDLIEKTLFSLEGFSQTSGVKLAYTSGQSKLVDIDQDKIQQVITNLVSNAIKFSPKDGTVEIKVEISESNHLKIKVCDDGEGISPEQQKNIFEKFRQATSAHKPIVKGTGLGLAIAKAVVEEHKGTIGVKSKVGEGSQFYFTLPDWRQDSVTMSFKDEDTKNKESKAA